MHTHILSKASEKATSKFATRRDGPYIITAMKGSSSYVIAVNENSGEPIGTYLSTALTPYKGPNIGVKYHHRKRGRPKVSTASARIPIYTNIEEDMPHSDVAINTHSDNDESPTSAKILTKC